MLGMPRAPSPAPTTPHCRWAARRRPCFASVSCDWDPVPQTRPLPFSDRRTNRNGMWRDSHLPWRWSRRWIFRSSTPERAPAGSGDRRRAGPTHRVEATGQLGARQRHPHGVWEAFGRDTEHVRTHLPASTQTRNSSAVPGLRYGRTRPTTGRENLSSASILDGCVSPEADLR